MHLLAEKSISKPFLHFIHLRIILDSDSAKAVTPAQLAIKVSMAEHIPLTKVTLFSQTTQLFRSNGSAYLQFWTVDKVQKKDVTLFVVTLTNV